MDEETPPAPAPEEAAPAPSSHFTDAGIVAVMRSSYLDYSMSVIVSRALPDVRDGLKPVQRRILYAMLREGLLHNRPFDKCAGVIGEVLKNYHPHGDASVYDALVRLAQPWVMRYPLIVPQGNFGSVDGDPAAAYRYTECKLQRFAEDILRDLDEETVDFVPNYKESTVEPAVLPGALPNLLLNGSTGIAVGMATNIPPHNLREIVAGAIALIDDPRLAMDDLLAIVRGPDFPTGGEIVGLAGVEKYLRTGRGIVRVRGRVFCETLKNGREQVIITELPYAVNRAALVEKIAELVTAKVLDEVSEIRDESDEKTRIVLELKRGEVPRVVTNKLFLHTPLESSFGAILLALDGRRPRQMNIREMLECFLEHRREVICRRTRFRLRRARDRAHVLAGFRIALDALEEFVRIIRAAADRERAKQELLGKFPLDGRQVDAILELRLYQLTGLERTKIDAEYGELVGHIAGFEEILADDSRLMGLIRGELEELARVYGDDRRTRILPAEGEFRMEDVIPNECCVVTVSREGFIKRTAADAYNTQRRGGKGVIGARQRETDAVEHLFSATTHDPILFFMDNGRFYGQMAYEIPEAARTAKGRSLVNLLALRSDERVAAMLCAKDFSESCNLVIGTRRGIVKKTPLQDYRNFRRGGAVGIHLDEGDRLMAALLTTGSDELMVVTREGMSIKFPESELRSQGRTTRGVRGITLRPGDEVQLLTVVDNSSSLLLATENGQGKRSHFEDYRSQGRGGVGVIAMRTRAPICAALSVRDNDQIMLLTRQGQAVRMRVSDVRIIGRTTHGVRLIQLAPDDTLVGVSPIVEVEDGD
ncbi:MAG: DNA gyrase subunit A [Puniceicoccales bacterium]|jgi:DNA gyrase subunit A|nr:DNA gyrase subunit A [Puniceicoccales bacterium]